MKKALFIFTMLSLLAPNVQAQDDMYFGSSKQTAKEVHDYGMPRDTYYSGSSRSVDEYNRRGGGYGSRQILSGDSAMSDVIDFSGGAGVYPDSTADFRLTRKMSRWDGYTPDEAYWQGYDQGRSDEWAASTWHSPWYYASYYYPWYDSWYDPWYYDRWYWRDPWYYRHYSYRWGGGYYGGYYSYHYPRHHYYPSGWSGRRSRGMVYSGTKGHSINRGNVVYGRSGYSRSSVGRSVSGSSSRSGISYGNARSTSPRTSSYGSARSSSSSSYGNSSSYGSSRSYGGSSGTSFGSSRSSGGGGGFSGSHGGGGGRSGGRR